jgi:hypothetical protein
MAVFMLGVLPVIPPSVKQRKTRWPRMGRRQTERRGRHRGRACSERPDILGLG